MAKTRQQLNVSTALKLAVSFNKYFYAPRC